MDRTPLHSQVTSAALHAIFLILAFSAPTALVLERMPDWALQTPKPARTVAFQEIQIRTWNGSGGTLAGQGGGGAGPGREEGSTMQSKSDPPKPQREIVARDLPEEVGELAELISGFGEETVGWSSSRG